MSARITTLLLSLLAAACAPVEREPEWDGRWRAWLDSPGGELPFHIELTLDDDGARAVLLNPPERIAVAATTIEGRTIELSIPHYDSRIVASYDDDGTLHGEWSKTAGTDGERSRLAFHAERDPGYRFRPGEGAIADDRFDGRWSVDFAEDELPAVAELEVDRGVATGTFLTATGDYRYLAGEARGDRLRLSVFDGAHAFLFDAELADDGSLRGDFWSRDSWHERWTAEKDPDAALPDPFAQTTIVDGVDFASLVYPDLDGNPRSLGDPAFAGKARLLVVFGTWCPNCNDASEFLVELDERYGERGLSILGLAFEMTGDAARDARQVRTYAEHHGIEYPILLAGTSDKAEAGAAFPLIDRVRSYPTTIFLREDGSVRAVYSGFSGPATGPAYERLRKQSVDLIEEMLAS